MSSPRESSVARFFVKADQAVLEHVPKKLLEFFDEDMLQLFESERFLFDHAISVGWEAL